MKVFLFLISIGLCSGSCNSERNFSSAGKKQRPEDKQDAQQKKSQHPATPSARDQQTDVPEKTNEQSVSDSEVPVVPEHRQPSPGSNTPQHPSSTGTASGAPPVNVGSGYWCDCYNEAADKCQARGLVLDFGRAPRAAPGLTLVSCGVQFQTSTGTFCSETVSCPSTCPACALQGN